MSVENRIIGRPSKINFHGWFELSPFLLGFSASCIVQEMQLSLPKVNSPKYGLNSFKYYAAKQWNMLPEEVRDKAGTKDFIKRIRNLDF